MRSDVTMVWKRDWTDILCHAFTAFAQGKETGRVEDTDCQDVKKVRALVAGK